ncbi:MAG: hypothetical protein AB1505_05705 [Candidatus Latescibacterota bacterium]
MWQRLASASWRLAVDDVRPFLERPAEAELLTAEHCRKLLLE